MKTFASFVSLASMASLLATTMLLLPACSTSSVDEREPVADEKEPVAETSQGISKLQLSIAGSLSHGETSGLTAYDGFPRYTAYELAGNAGDELDVWVRSQNGDPVAFIVDEDLRILAWNDDASRFDTNAHLKLTLPAKASGTHYVVVRDYWFSKMTFEVTLGGTTTAPSAGCDVDSDCERIEKGCCDLGEYIAVRVGEVDAYRAGLACAEPLFCPLIMVLDDQSVAQCNEQTHECEVVKPKDIECNAFSPNPHACPDGWQCRVPDFVADAPGKCVQPCGGFAGLACTSPDDQCLDDPKDDCDPNAGGADCGGICVGKNDDCRVTSCGAGKTCTPCLSGAWSCVPQGGGC